MCDARPLLKKTQVIGPEEFRRVNIAQAASFRDPQGRVLLVEKRVLRVLTAAGELSLRQFMDSSPARRLLEAGALIQTRFLPPAEARGVLEDSALVGVLDDMECSAVVEHCAVPFPNYPHEWAPEMLHAAGELTIRLALELLDGGLGLKDATPSNIMFCGPDPVFLDMLSFEERSPRDPTWLPYAQFVRTFLLPLFANRRFSMLLSDIFLTRRDGLEPEEVYPLMGRFERLRPSALSLVSFPVWFAKRSDGNQKLYQPRLLKDPEQARYILRSLLRRQQRALRRLAPRQGLQSVWSDYTSNGHNNYSDTQLSAKEETVRRMLEEIRPGDTLDIGCNTGVFSFLAAAAGSRVVSIDFDPVVIGRLWLAARQKKAAILPLVVNIARPSPAVGWSNAESRSFLDRGRGAFDAVLMLAVLHHLLVTERVPLPEILSMARDLTRKHLIIEYVGPSDSMFVRLTRGRAHLHEGYCQESFEAVARRYFRIVRAEQVPGADRRLYLLERV